MSGRGRERDRARGKREKRRGEKDEAEGCRRREDKAPVRGNMSPRPVNRNQVLPGRRSSLPPPPTVGRNPEENLNISKVFHAPIGLVKTCIAPL